MKTLKEIADQLGVSKDKVKYQSRKLPSNLLVKKEDGVTYVTYAGIELIKKALEDKIGNVTQGTTQEITSELPTELLKPYLDQIEELKKDKEFLQNRLIKAEIQANEHRQIIAMEIKDKEVLQLELKEFKETKSRWKKFWSK